MSTPRVIIARKEKKREILLCVFHSFLQVFESGFFDRKE